MRALFYLLLITIYNTYESSTVTTQQTIIPTCLLRCKDAHMMQNEWSMDFAFPLLSLLRTNNSEAIVKQKISDICNENYDLKKCLQRCVDSILQIGLEPWMEICSNLRTLQFQSHCWKANIDVLAISCHHESHNLRSSMEVLTRNSSLYAVSSVCQDLRNLGMCSVYEYGKYCGPESKKLIFRLFEINQKSMKKMLQIKWNDLPAECTNSNKEEKLHKAEYQFLENNGALCHHLKLIHLIIILFLKFFFK